MIYHTMQYATKNLSEDKDYRNTLFLNPEKIVNDFSLEREEWMAMNAKFIVSPRVAITKETGMTCCGLCSSCAPPLRKN